MKDKTMKKQTAWIACPDCKASGMQDYGWTIGTCYYCSGNCFVRARDSKGRFVKVVL